MNNIKLAAMKRTTIVSLYIFLSGTIFINKAIAQTTDKSNLGNEDVTIIKEYQPVLNDAFKINMLPEGDTSTAAPSNLHYSLDPLNMNSSFNLTPIKPVKIKDDVIKKLYHGFAKVGYGNYNTPLLEFSYNSLRSKLYDAGVQFKHISSTGNINGYGHPDFGVNNLGVNGTRYFEKNALKAELNYNRNLYHFYGYQSPPELFSKSETKHLMNLLTGKFGFYSTGTDKDVLAYDAGINFTSFSDNRESSETMLSFLAGGGKKVNDSYISGKIGLDATNVSQPLQDNSRIIFRTMPRYAFKKDKYYLTAGVNLAYESGDNIDTKIHLYPDVEAKFQLLSEEVSVYGKFTGNLQTTSLANFSQENQFLNNATKLLNTNDKVDLSAGINAKLSKELLAIASFSFSRITNQPYFINLNNPEEPVKYSLTYDNLSLANIHAEMNYAQVNKAGIGIKADYYFYSTDKLDKPLFKPAYKIGLNGNYEIADKIFIKSEFYYNAGVYAFELSGVNGNYVRLKNYADINIGAEYKYSKILTGFVQLNNIGMQKYFRWYNYPSYRMNVMAGVTYSFW